MTPGWDYESVTCTLVFVFEWVMLTRLVSLKVSTYLKITLSRLTVLEDRLYIRDYIFLRDCDVLLLALDRRGVGSYLKCLLLLENRALVPTWNKLHLQCGTL